MSSKISALTTGTTANDTDKIPIERGGVNRYITPAMIHAQRGLVVSATTAADVDYANLDDTRVNFATVDYDPGADVTTGASWVYTAPATGWYRFVVTDAFVDPRSAAWGANAYVQMDLYVNGSIASTLAYFESGGTAGTDQWVLLHGSRAVSMTAGQTAYIHFVNESSATRRLTAFTALEIYRVA